jgi:hypothetical protein
MGVGRQGFMQLLMTVHEYERRYQVLKKAVSDGVLDDDGGEEPELETSERLSSLNRGKTLFKMKMKMHMTGDLRIRWWGQNPPHQNKWAWWLPGKRSPFCDQPDKIRQDSDEEEGESVTFGQELLHLKKQQSKEVSAATVWRWKCLQQHNGAVCDTVNSTESHFCSRCHKLRRSAELIKNPGLAVDSEMLDEHDELFCAPVFLSDNFEQLLTGEPTLHEATSVPQDG